MAGAITRVGPNMPLLDHFNPPLNLLGVDTADHRPGRTGRARPELRAGGKNSGCVQCGFEEGALHQA
jgi:hypothetical protein